MINISENGIVYRREDGEARIYVPDKNGRKPNIVLIEREMADEYRLMSGDIVTGSTKSLATSETETQQSDERMEDELFYDDERDEPSAVRGVFTPAWLISHSMPSEKLVAIERINGLTLPEAEERPFPRQKRSHSERASLERRILLAVDPDDTTGRMLDFAAPLAIGSVGFIAGPHASGLTRTLRAVIAGTLANAPDIVPVILLLRARGEERTDWRRRFPGMEIVVAPSPQEGATSEEMLRVADLTLAAALRQTEMGKHILLAVDSWTALWGAMLEVEAADAQNEADQSGARHRIREWAQKAGDFRGSDPLGGSLGGSLTLVGTMWQTAVDAEAEEEGEVHPHLRLLEHLVHDTSWRVWLSGKLAEARLYPAIDTVRSLSLPEDRMLSESELERRSLARRALSDLTPFASYNRLMDALESTPDEQSFLAALNR